MRRHPERAARRRRDRHRAAPYGLRGIGEAPTLSATPAVLAAIRQATGLELNRTPVRPEHLTGT
jgi:CO/xanthine dehydrogenase Mo-binding subunit